MGDPEAVAGRRGRLVVWAALLVTVAGSVACAGEAASAAAALDGAGAAKMIGLAFAWGLMMSLTPCVYPMIFITAAIVGGREEKGKLSALAGSMAYVLGLSVVYGLIGLLVGALGGEVRFFLDTAWVRVPMGILFFLLALTMFDVFSVSFGQGFVARLRSTLAGRAGLRGIFAIGAVSALAASPCLTGPLAYLLVRVAEKGSMTLGFFSLFAMAWGMGVVLIIAGTSTSLLPRAGAWMNWVKHLLGFVLLWAAVYFLRPIIGESVFLAASGGVVIAGAVFLGAIDRLTAESSNLERLRAAAGVTAIVLGAGLLLHGLGFVPSGAQRAAAGPAGAESVWTADAGYADYEKALVSDKPLVIDFHGEDCTICKKLKRLTFSDERVLAELRRSGFTALSVNTYKEKSLRKQFGIVGVPTVIFFDAQGREVARFSGFKGPEEFLDLLGRAAGRAAGPAGLDIDALLGPGAPLPGTGGAAAGPDCEDGICPPDAPGPEKNQSTVK